MLMMFNFSMDSIMDNIIEASYNFDFAKLSLAHPTAIQGGAHFTKLLMNGKPLYIQTPKCTTRQGFIKTGKKIHCDLMFNNNDEEFIHWMKMILVKERNEMNLTGVRYWVPDLVEKIKKELS